jgi:DNA-binding beta-propeller fold protein YncE
MNVKLNIICYLLSTLLFTACLPDTVGQDPPPDQLIYPLGLTITAEDKYLLVANSNFDLKYNAGTLTTISLNNLQNVIDSGGDKKWESIDGKVMYVPESELIEPENTIRLDAIAADLELTPKKNRALVPIRGSSERHILIVDVDESAKNGRVLNCGQGKDLSCDSAHKVTSNEQVTMPIEPYEVTAVDYSRTVVDDNNQEITVSNTIGFATHLFSGSVSAFLIDNSQGDLDATLLGVADNVVNETSGIASNPVNGEVYVSGRENPDSFVAVMQVLAGGAGGTYTNKPYFGVTDKITLGRDLLGGTDARGIAVSSDGTKALVVTRTPEALIRVDTKSRRMVDMTTLGTGPTVVGLFEDEAKTYAFVLCYESNQVFIIDPDTMVSVVRTTGSGPQAIVFDKTRKLAYIANFRESTISVIQAIPPFDHVRVGEDQAKLMIGTPRLPEGHN